MKKYAWIGFVVSLLAMSVIVHGALLYVAVKDPSFAVEPDYEAKAKNWDKLQRERQASARLGWTTDLSTQPASRPGEVDVALDLFDRYGKRIHEAGVTLEAFHLARGNRILRGHLVEAADGAYRATLPIRRSGVWEFQLRVVHGEDRYLETRRTSVISTPRSTDETP